MKINGKLFAKEKIVNTDRHFGAQKDYYPIYIEQENGDLTPALFTQSQINVAINRASQNKEDVPKKNTFLSFIFG
jgi:hypothetical protein